MAVNAQEGKTWVQKGGFAMGFIDNEETVMSCARHGHLQEDRFGQKTMGHNVFNDGFYSREDGFQYDREEFPKMRANAGYWFMEPFYRNGFAHYNMPRDNVAGEHSMWNSFFKPFVTSQNVGANKPVIDLSRPLNSQSREDLSREYGTRSSPLQYTFWSDAHFMWTPEIVPYTDTYSTRDCIAGAFVSGNIVAVSNYFQKYYYNGGQTWRNPRTAWAHRLTAMFKFARLQMAIAIGAGGYFAGYEFFYTHMPFLRIRDPRPEGWKTPWRDGQSTFAARAAAACFPCFAHSFYTGSLRRFSVYFPIWQAANLSYEVYRWMVSGSAMFWKQRSKFDEDLRVREGSLEPGSVAKFDPNTGRPQAMASYQEWKKRPGRELTNPIDNPGHYDGYAFANPSYNPVNGKQAFLPNPVHVANDSWSLPDPLTHELYGSGASLAGPRDYTSRVISGHSYGQFTHQ